MRELASRVGGRDLFEWIEERARHLANLGRTSDGAVRVNRRLRSVCGIESITPDAMSARAELRPMESATRLGLIARYRKRSNGFPLPTR